MYYRLFLANELDYKSCKWKVLISVENHSFGSIVKPVLVKLQKWDENLANVSRFDGQFSGVKGATFGAKVFLS